MKNKYYMDAGGIPHHRDDGSLTPQECTNRLNALAEREAVMERKIAAEELHGKLQIAETRKAIKTEWKLIAAQAVMERVRKSALDEYCKSCGEIHPSESMCPPYETRTTGRAWTMQRIEYLETRLEGIRALLAPASETEAALATRSIWKTSLPPHDAVLLAQVDLMVCDYDDNEQATKKESNTYIIYIDDDGDPVDIEEGEPIGWTRKNITRWVLLEDVEAVLTSAPVTCTWTFDLDGHWSTDCGAAWPFVQGDPDANGVKFCPYCGRRVDTVVPADGTSAPASEKGGE